MSGQSRVVRRVAQLEADRNHAAVRQLARRMAAELRVTPHELLREAEALAARWQGLDARTLDAQCAHLAADLGLSPDEVHAEVVAMRERFA
jgi:hypothetical protein